MIDQSISSFFGAAYISK